MIKEDKELLQQICAYLEMLTSHGVERAEKSRPALFLENTTASGEFLAFCKVFQEFMEMLHEAYAFQKKIAAGDLSAEVDKMNFLAMPLRGMQSSLKHLTWQASQVAKGNLNQTVQFLGEFADSFNSMIAALKEKELMQSRLLHAQKMESVGQLAAGIAHEINTPIQFIGTNLEFILESVSEIDTFISELKTLPPLLPSTVSEKIQTALDEMDWEYLEEELPKAVTQSRDGIERISSIILALKAFSCKQSSEKKHVNLNELIQTTMTVSSHSWRTITSIETEFAADLPEVPILENDMGQVFLNILINAVHAISECHDNPLDTGKIKISTHLVGENVELRMSDNGSGMPETVRQRIFEPFFTTKEVGKGTGQGLAIAYDLIVNKHNGSLEYESTEGEGTTVILRLPLQ